MITFLKNLFKKKEEVPDIVTVHAEIAVAWISTFYGINCSGHYILFSRNNKRDWKYVGQTPPSYFVKSITEHDRFVHVERFLLDGYYPPQFAAKQPVENKGEPTTNLEKFEKFMKEQGY